ncbi:MAG: dTDP-4-dehydrorhamnose 3,5-epimerase [Bacilli bacterium]|jgi:dTDP-4-dehydrorhamnose 3,5-epimerase|nr:dTDP-4-dehydrorhamnose 3,5-epimerase [Bacilli bacterium]
MTKFYFKKLPLEGAFLITPFSAPDLRGSFIKDYSKEAFMQNGIDYNLEEVFYTVSHKGVIRAIHFQRVKQQPKLVRCVSGHVFDVIVDLRRDSKTFKKWMGFDLTGENMKEILVPAGFGHGYLVFEDSIVSYKCAAKFDGEYDSGIIWNDKTLNVSWPLDKLDGAPLILSDKDKHLMTFEQFLRVKF